MDGGPCSISERERTIQITYKETIMVRFRFHKTDFLKQKIFAFSFYIYVSIKYYIYTCQKRQTK